MYKINHANIKEWAANYDGEPFDAILCDPPYELGFMGKSWDSSGIAFDKDMWADLFRHIKPGGHLLAFSGSRTYHRMAVAIEDAGFEIRDMIEWVYGSGFPKSLNVGKAVDKLQDRGFEEVCELGRHIKECRESKGISRKEVNEKFGAVAICNHWEAQDRNNALPPTVEHWNILKTYLGCSDKFDFIVERVGKERDVVGLQEKAMSGWNMDGSTQFKDRYITKGTSEWEGWGTALKPAHEPICMARKPLAEKTVALNVLKYGTGGINIDESRVGTTGGETHKGGFGSGIYGDSKGVETDNTPTGRFPANLIHDGSDEVEAVFPQTGGGKYSKQTRQRKGFMLSGSEDNVQEANAPDNYGDSGSASRFFYTAKSSRAERNAGLDEPNTHPTLKPLSLTKYLATLIKPPTGGRLLVPFSGSGSEMIGALQAGWEYVEGVELTEEYIPIAEARIEYWLSKKNSETEQVSLF